MIDQPAQTALVHAHLPGLTGGQARPFVAFKPLRNAVGQCLWHVDLKGLGWCHGVSSVSGGMVLIVDMTTQEHKSVKTRLT